MSNFLLELRSEEIPARMQKGARAELEKLFRREMDAAGVALGELTVWSTPRRLALIARDLPTQTDAVSEEAKGPPEGAPDQAVDGFCRKNGVSRDQLEVRDVKGRPTYFAVINTPGRAVAEVLAEAIPAIIRDFSWPKSQRWGAASISTESLRWVRPLSGIVALMDGDVVACETHGITSGNVTKGHRFHHNGEITIGSADDYAAKLRDAHVIVDHEERQNIIRTGAAKAAQDAGLDLVEDEGLVIENAGLTEWPVPLLGRFEDDFLEVPPETIQLTARVNQKYFVCEKDGKLANAFICTSNIEAEDPAVVVEGNRKVLAARLSDAKFFWDVDRKKTLAEHAKGLERITFHEKLGTVADKVERVGWLAKWLTQLNFDHGLGDAAEKAAGLCKADLVTEMVGEFPELQGLMGGYYARAEGLGDAVADAIRDHYKPIGKSDEIPTAPLTVAVSLADKLDTLAGFFSIDAAPTGSKDPFALRRAALSSILLIQHNNLRVGLASVLERHMRQFGSESPQKLLDFFADRLKVQQRDAGVRHDLIDAVFALGGEDDLVRLLARVHALQSFMATEDGTNLLAGYKRASNILKKEEWDNSDSTADNNNSLSYAPETSEKALIDALDAAGPKAASAIESEDFEGAMAALASLRSPIDEFFDHVTVNDSDADKRAARLDLLARFRSAVHQVADFSRIEG
ncbi:glycine--tRNA ligase subunit beta [Altererythrobacter sp. RZ02]|uniref:Glycine--tRNA ligase beta subunit n=1 Tax=Pontixanthobacter rizhaonensis TaxID=2730337 RepID=A0A848QMH6_9SPHN|nr:glycine--tRNA ligase subunit beta [Pontixanthobacter rizhaonensis]NMW31365.1 glycine--tRNA ligase subunit beta [Pontixanthobacter rizhaonensis]